MTTKEEFERRIEEARKIEDAGDKAETLSSIASEQAKAGIDPAPLFREAFKIVQEFEIAQERAINEDFRKNYDFFDLLNFGDSRFSERRAQLRERCEYLREKIGLGQTEAGLFEDAIETACAISETRKERGDLLVKIARASVEALGKLQKAREGELQKPNFKKPAQAPKLELCCRR